CLAATGRSGDDWKADSKHADLPAGPMAATGARGRTGRALYRRGRFGPWISETAEVNGGEIYTKSLWWGRDSPIPDRGLGVLSARREFAVFGAPRSAGEGERLSHRVG